MKTNLPTTWNSQKISALFLLTFLKTNVVKSGQVFKDCMTFYNKTGFYNSLVNYPFYNNNNITNNEILWVCCDNSQCSPWTMTNCPKIDTYRCYKIGSTVFCDYNVCAGIVGDTQITTNTTIGNCPDLTLIANNITAMIPDHGYVQGHCPATNPCKDFNQFYCNWDSGGWTCYDNHNNPSGYCYLQWTNQTDIMTTAPSSISLSSFSSISSIISTSENSTNNPNLTIIIPATIGGSAVVVSVAGCYLYKKKKVQQKKTSQETPVLPTLEEVDLLELPTKGELSNETKNQSLSPQEELFQKSDIINARQDNLAYQNLLTQIRNKLGNDQGLLENFLDAQEILQNNGNLLSARRNFQRAQQALGEKIGWQEISSLENPYLQKPDEQYINQIEIPSKN